MDPPGPLVIAKVFAYFFNSSAAASIVCVPVKLLASSPLQKMRSRPSSPIIVLIFSEKNFYHKWIRKT